MDPLYHERLSLWDSLSFLLLVDDQIFKNVLLVEECSDIWIVNVGGIKPVETGIDEFR